MIYTTSFRSEFSLRRTFWCYGIQVDGVINESKNQKTLRQNGCTASKNPLLYGIDVHIDDSKGVEMEDNRLGFKTIIVDQNDMFWTFKVEAAILALEKAMKN